MKTIFRILKIGGGVATAGFILLALVFGVALFRESREHTAQKRWEWNHYTGYRLFVVEDEEDKAHGILRDSKIGTGREALCTTMNYPGYPACPPQEYVFNGKSLAPGMMIDLNGNVVPIPPGAVINPLDSLGPRAVTKRSAVTSGAWIPVDIYGAFGGRTSELAIPNFAKEGCTPGSRGYGTDKVEWICVVPEERPEGLPDNGIISPAPPIKWPAAGTIQRRLK